ncbi:amidohydrolase [Moritella sp. 5]|uniref:amidohydrolase n=1 Tax=Moritella sp. 5 TaxID=2746231 RepID=UPI001BA65B9D|nr:amidohydrolase [Moritella sp. 5]QUM81536.1 amidohydrolase [Moritella sp. 5]
MIKFSTIVIRRSALSLVISTMLISPITLAGIGGNTFFHNKDVLFYNGNIITMKTSPDGDLLNENTGALCIIKGKIASVGSDVKSLGRHCRYLPKNKKVNLEGKTLVPGFIDSHSHFLIHGLYAPFADLQSPPLGDVVRIGDDPSALDDQSTLLGALNKKSEDWTGWSSRNWIMGNGYDDTLLKDREHPTTKQLDLIDRAVYVTHTSSHMGSANTKALEKAGIYGVDGKGFILNKHSERILDDSDNGICCGVKGQSMDIESGSYKPNGVLKEAAHAYALTKVASHIPLEQVLLGLLSVGERYLSVGVTTAQDGLTPKAAYSGRLLKIIQAISKTPRLVILPDQESAEAIGDFDSPNFLPKETDYFKVGGVKLVLDGSIQGYTGYLSDPYYSITDNDCPDPKDHCKNWKGEAQIKELNELVQKLLKNNWQIYAHVNGDAAMEQYLVAIETAISTGVISKEEVRARRLVAIHAQVTTPGQMDRLKDLGMIASFFTEHVYYWGLRHKEIFLGNSDDIDGRAENISATGWAKERNLRFTLHSDAPIVPIDPMHIMETAVKREMCNTNTVTVKGSCDIYPDVLGFEHKLTWDEALMANTVTAAYQYGEEDTRGSLEVGKFGDVVVLSGDPRSSKDTPTVLRTYVDGKLLFKKGDDKDDPEKVLSVLRKVIKSGGRSSVRSLIPDNLHSKGLEKLAAMKNDDIKFLIQNLPSLEKLYFQHGGH